MRVLPLIAVGLGACGPDVPDRHIEPRKCLDLPYEDPHDGVDQDCDPANEYDFDGDGFVVDRLWTGTDGWVDALPAATAWAEANGLGPVRGGDCDDFDAAVFPGAPGEVPYDAIDTDCDGANDFDVDGDGWIPVGYWNAAAYYVANYLDGFATFDVLEGDCDDGDPAVSPVATDVPYDGIDSDCDTANDFDVDGDGFVASGYEAAFRAVGSVHPIRGFGDCDDQNDFVSPVAPERLVSPRDVDCDGASDGAWLVVHDLGLRHAGPAVYAGGETLEALVLAAGAADGFAGPGTFAFATPFASDLDDVLGVLRLSDVRAERLAVRPETPGVTAILAAGGAWGAVPLGAPAPQGPQIGPATWTDGPLPGLQVVATDDGVLTCGGGPTVWSTGEVLGPEVESCGVLDGVPVLCDPACVALEARGPVELPWVSPTRITGGHALIDGQLYGLDGARAFHASDATDAAVAGDWAAWIAGGEVWVEGPTGVVGPLHAVVAGWQDVSERPVDPEFTPDSVQLGVRWGHVTVMAVEHRDGRVRVGRARLDP